MPSPLLPQLCVKLYYKPIFIARSWADYRAGWPRCVYIVLLYECVRMYSLGCLRFAPWNHCKLEAVIESQEPHTILMKRTHDTLIYKHVSNAALVTRNGLVTMVHSRPLCQMEFNRSNSAG